MMQSISRPDNLAIVLAQSVSRPDSSVTVLVQSACDIRNCFFAVDNNNFLPFDVISVYSNIEV